MMFHDILPLGVGWVYPRSSPTVHRLRIRAGIRSNATSPRWPDQCYVPVCHTGRRIQATVVESAKHTRVTNHRPHTVSAVAHPINDEANSAGRSPKT